MNEQHWTETILDIHEKLKTSDDRIIILENRVEVVELPLSVNANGQLCVNVQEKE